MSTTWRPRIESQPTRDQRYTLAVAYPECSAWQTAIELDGLAARTRLDYLRSVAAFIVAYNTRPETWTHLDVNAFLTTYPAGSRRKVRAHLASFFTWLEDEEIIAKSPMKKVRRPRPNPQAIHDIFEPDEAAAMCENPLLALMLQTGLRKGECRHLQRKHINLDRAELRVVNGKGGKDRIVDLNQIALKAVADIDLLERIDADDFLWSTKPGGGSVVQRDKPIGEASFHRWWVKSLERAGVDYRNPHTARHTYATMLRRRGLGLDDISELLGHASVSTTASVYVHTRAVDIAGRIRAIEAREAGQA